MNPGAQGPRAASHARGGIALSGAVLCGGRSRRMGSDKALLELGGSALLDRAISVLREACDEVVLACGAVPRYADRGLPLALDPEPDAGPLGGLVAALESTRGEWVAVLAVDLPRAEPALPRLLLARAENERADCCLLATDGGREPLIAVYRRTCLAPARAALRAGLRRADAFHAEVRVAMLREAELPPELCAHSVATNLNTPADVARERGEPGRADGEGAPRRSPRGSEVSA